MSLGDILPTVNASLNATSFVLLVCGFLAIRSGKRDLHRKLMTATFVVSCVFLASYLTRFALTGTTRFPGTGALKTLYLVILFSHMPLAIAVVPLSIRALYLAWKQRFPEHKRVTRWLYPIWTYVSITGVVVYLMLYHLPGLPPPIHDPILGAAAAGK